MNFKNFILILIFLIGCTVNSNQYSENFFSNKGFTLLSDESLVKKKILRKNLDERSLEIVHNSLPKGSKVRIINLLNGKSATAIVKNSNKDLIFYNSILSKRIFDELDISSLKLFFRVHTANANLKDLFQFKIFS